MTPTEQAIIRKVWTAATHQSVKGIYNTTFFTNDKIHRGSPLNDEDLPAIEYDDGKKVWYRNGKIHRGKDLPAVEHGDGEKGWWVNGKKHRNKGLPAIIDDNRQEWWVNGKKHRKDGPAFQRVTGIYTHEEWWLKDKKHRENGPAVTVWCRFDSGITRIIREEWWHHGNLHRNEVDNKGESLPAIIAEDDMQWYRHGELHRLDGYARLKNGDKEWWVNGRRHRDENRPAVIPFNGRKQWWVNGEVVNEKEGYLQE